MAPLLDELAIGRTSPAAKGQSLVKVGIVCPYDWSVAGGVRTHILGLTWALRRKGIEVDLIAPASKTEDDVYVVGRTISVPINGSKARFNFSRSSKRRLQARISKGDLDLLHLHEPLIPSTSLQCLMIDSGPMVATFHAFASNDLPYLISRPLLGRYAARITTRIAVSQAAEDLASRHFPGEYLRIPNGIEASRFASGVPRPDLLELKPFVLFVGRPDKRKGLHVALEAFSQLKKKMDVRMVAVGPTPADVQGNPDVFALGPQDQSILPSIYAAADVYCSPAIGNESFGIVLIEGMASGVPVVCSDLPGYMEAAGGAALLSPAGNPEELARRLQDVLEDSRLANDLVARGRVRAKVLDWEVVSGDLLEVYRSAVSLRQ